jgi:hypothetical protein
MFGLRLITRPQSLIRAFFGLGPDQFSLQDVIAPTFDVDMLMRSNQDTQVISGESAAIGAGAFGEVQITPPSAGTWLLHAVGLTSAGPATSGTFRMTVGIDLNSGIWPGGARIAVADKYDALPRPPSGSVRLGWWFRTPITLIRLPVGTTDLVIGGLFNEAASVGNATVTVAALLRPVQSVGS